MGSFPSKQLEGSELIELRSDTGMSQYQIQRLYSRFMYLDRRQCGALCPPDLLRIPELVLNPLRQRIIDALFEEARVSINVDATPTAAAAGVSSAFDVGNLNFRQFLRVCRVFVKPKFHELLTERQRREDRRRKLRFLHRVIDPRGGGSIRRGDLFDVLLLVGQHRLGVWRCEHIFGRTNGWPRTPDGDGKGGVAPHAEHALRDKLEGVLNAVFAGREQLAYSDFDALIEELDLDRLMGIEMWHNACTTNPATPPKPTSTPRTRPPPPPPKKKVSSVFFKRR